MIKRYTDEKFLSLVCAPHQAEYKTVCWNLKDSFSYKDPQYCANFFLSNLYDECSVNGKIEAFELIWDDIIGEHEGESNGKVYLY